MVGVSCVAYKCRRGYKGNRETQPLFKFPADSSRRALWLRALRIEANYNITNSSGVCGKHFDESDFAWERQDKTRQRSKNLSPRCSRPKLIETAVPRIFADAPKYLTTEKPAERSTKTTTQARLDAENEATSVAQHQFLIDSDLIENLDELSAYFCNNDPTIPVGFVMIHTNNNNNGNNNIVLAIMVDKQNGGPELTASIKICADMTWSVAVQKCDVPINDFSDIATDRITNFCQAS